jgi:hypothetical protein
MGLIEEMDTAGILRDAYTAKWGGADDRDVMLDRARRLLRSASAAILDLQARVAVLEGIAGVPPAADPPPNPSP